MEATRVERPFGDTVGGGSGLDAISGPKDQKSLMNFPDPWLFCIRTAMAVGEATHAKKNYHKLLGARTLTNFSFRHCVAFGRAGRPYTVFLVVILGRLPNCRVFLSVDYETR